MTAPKNEFINDDPVIKIVLTLCDGGVLIQCLTNISTTKHLSKLKVISLD